MPRKGILLFWETEPLQCMQNLDQSISGEKMLTFTCSLSICAPAFQIGSNCLSRAQEPHWISACTFCLPNSFSWLKEMKASLKSNPANTIRLSGREEFLTLTWCNVDSTEVKQRSLTPSQTPLFSVSFASRWTQEVHEPSKYGFNVKIAHLTAWSQF